MTEFLQLTLVITFVVVVTGAVLATVIEVAVRSGVDAELVRRRPGRTRRRGSPRG